MKKSKERIQLEADVKAFNSPLKNVVGQMETVVLIRNCHPLYRKQHARALMLNGEITEQEFVQFDKEYPFS